MASKRSLASISEALLTTSRRPASRSATRLTESRTRTRPRTVFFVRTFHNGAALQAVKSVNLTDIGEGTTEAAIIQWKVKEGASVKEWDPLCEVTTDKAMTEISSKYSGIIKKIHYQKDEIAKVGQPLYDIDVEGEEATEEDTQVKQNTNNIEEDSVETSLSSEVPDTTVVEGEQTPKPRAPGKFATLATPAVRHLSKKLDIDISQISGTGKDGRVLKEDLQRFSASTQETSSIQPSGSESFDTPKPLTPFQTQMFKTMTKSLSIPHFLFTDTISLDSLSALRKSLKADALNPQSISPLPFFVKAISLAFKEYPLLNSHLETSEGVPSLTQRTSHNFGIAMDTPSGLVVPVLKDVQSQTVASIATQIADLASRARQGKLGSSDLKGATFTISNVGSISGGVVAPVITAPQVGIVGIGKSRVVPAFDQDGNLIRREELTLSWSADHRVVDGAMVARAAEMVKQSIEDVGKMLLKMH